MGLPIIVVGAGGRMGKIICELVLDHPDMDLCGMVERTEYQPRVAPVDCVVSDDFESVVDACPQEAVVIDFSNPQASLHSAEVAAKRGISLVIGTTGFSPEEQETLKGYARKTRIFWSPNMSVGVSVLQKILPELTRALGPDYDVDIAEIHHHNKTDAPSGTALRLGECVAEAWGWDLANVRNSARDGRHHRPETQGRDRHHGPARRRCGRRAHRVLHGTWRVHRSDPQGRVQGQLCQRRPARSRMAERTGSGQALYHEGSVRAEVDKRRRKSGPGQGAQGSCPGSLLSGGRGT